MSAVMTRARTATPIRKLTFWIGVILLPRKSKERIDSLDSMSSFSSRDLREPLLLESCIAVAFRSHAPNHASKDAGDALSHCY
jgi:hypothetical protein